MDTPNPVDSLDASFDIVARQDASDAAIEGLRGDVEEVKSRLDKVSRAAARPVLDGAAPTPSIEVKSFVNGYLRLGRENEVKSISGAVPGIRSELELGELIAFFRARRGAARGFRLRDPTDFSSNAMTGTPSAADQLIGLGDGAATEFALIKRYGEGEDAQLRRITRPRADSLLVQVGGVMQTTGWTLGPLGVITFAAAPAAGAEVRAGFLFDVPVRFAEDSLQVSGASFAAGEAPTVPIVEVREAS